MKAPKLLNPTSIKAVKGFEITPVFFKNSGGEVLRAEINPALPLGLKLTIDNKSCVISGTPLEFSANGIYLLTAVNEQGESSATIEISVVEAPIKTQREAIIRQHHLRGDLDTPRSQVDNALSDHASMNSSIKPHEKFKTQPMGDDKRLSQQTQNNPDAENRARNNPELTPSPSAKLQAQAVNAAKPQITPKPGA